MTAPPDLLVDAILTLADEDGSTPDEVKYLVLAALDGDTALSDAVDGRYDCAEPAPVDGTPSTEPVGAFLRSITVSGFRGVGPECTLTLHPAPGLTVVAGRNGSGKSTFAEALEVGLTSKSYRWAERAVDWQNAWGNLHVREPRHIRIRIGEQDVGTTTVGVDWAPGVERFDDLTCWVQRPGAKREDGLGSLGWGDAIGLYRPMLSYEEVSGLLTSEPKRLYDALCAILGLDQLVTAQQRLDTLKKTTSAPVDDARTGATALKKTLAESTDERAAEALRLLRKHSRDLDALRALATGSRHTSAGTLSSLRDLAELEVPDRATVDRAAEGLRTAVGALAATADDAADAAARRLLLLRQAVELHEHHGSGAACPVCGVGVLDAGWRAAADAELAGRADDERGLTEARRVLVDRRATALELLRAVRTITPPPDVPLASLERATAAVHEWMAAPEDDLGLADHLVHRHTALAAAFAALRAEADQAWRARQDAWAPLATRLGTWVESEEAARAAAPLAERVRAAADWLKDSTERLRNRRLEPLADDARRVWAALRQESNVDLKKITLPKPVGNRRQVAIAAEVDGADAGALGVMSTGELHALALALFLPRATRPESPFRFVVLDDPIQAMDPSKIDGLVSVLAEHARTRQVVVFSHDDRLPEAVRRLVPDARIAEVTRGAGSVVEIGDAQDPAQRDVDDARAFVRDQAVPDELIRRVVPRLCRSAVETAARDAWFARAFADGADRQAVESTWSDARNQPQRIALALFGDRERSPDAWLRAAPHRSTALRVCGSANHGLLRSEPKHAVECVAKLVDDLRATVR